MIDERDLARIGEASLDVDEVPTWSPNGPDQREGDEPAPPVRRGRPPGWKAGRQQVQPPARGRLDLIRQRDAARAAPPAPAVSSRAVAAEPPTEPAPATSEQPWVTTPEAATALGRSSSWVMRVATTHDLGRGSLVHLPRLRELAAPPPAPQAAERPDASDGNMALVTRNEAEIIPAAPPATGRDIKPDNVPPAEPAQEQNVSTDTEWVSTTDAATTLKRSTSWVTAKIRKLNLETRPGARSGEGRHGIPPRLVSLGRLREVLDQTRELPPAFRAKQAKQGPRQAPARGAQPGRSEVKAKPRPAAPSVPVAAMVAAHVTVTHVGGTLGPFLDALSVLVGTGLLSQTKADRVLAVLLEG